MKKLPFKQYVREKLSFYQVVMPLALSFVFALFISGGIFVQYLKADKNLGEAIAPHLSTLLETQDRSEIQRLLKSISEKQNVNFELINGDEIISSTLDLSRVGQNTDQAKTQKRLTIYKNSVAIKTGTTLHVYSELATLINWIFTISLTSFVLIFAFTKGVIGKVLSVSEESLMPLVELEKAIKNLRNNLSLSEIKNFPILELESIRGAFVETYASLQKSNRELAHAKAKEMTTVAYQKLIHDLGVPIAALKNRAAMLTHERATEADKEKALGRVIDLTEQILNQIKSARENLSLDVNLKTSNIITSIREAVETSRSAASKNIDLFVNCKIEELFSAHDPILLTRALNNLIGNALEAAESYVALDVDYVDNELYIKIKNDGNGLTQEEASLHLQGRGSSSKSERFGIGLSSANHIVNSHGGKIIYNGSPTEGACFTVFLRGEAL